MRGAAALLMLAMASPALAQQPRDWDVKFYNPHPAQDDLVMPLPCGGALAFRPVDVPTENGPLDDRLLTMGDPDRGFGVAEYVHTESLAAPFTSPDGSRRYWIGKYVVTRDQLAAMHGTCATPSFGGRVAQTGISQIEAIEAAAEWSAWLLSNAREKLPKRGGEFAYARLPTEAEWEFAARGGTKVSASEFQARTWPMPDGIEHYVVAGNVADGRAQQIGVEAKPNPSGLSGVLGSVDQMMLEPFRLNRVGRLQGDPGGVILRGGNYKNDLEGLHVGMRTEMRPFDPDKRQPTRLPTVGFRLVLSATTSGDIVEAEAQRKAFATLIKARTDALTANSPRALLDVLRKDATDPTQKRELDQLDASLASSERAQGDRDRAALHAQIETATVMASFIWRLERNIRIDDSIGTYVEARAERTAAGNIPDNVRNFKQNMLKAEGVMRGEQAASLDGYLRSLRDIAVSPVHSEAEQEASVVQQEMEGRGQHQLKGFLPVVLHHLAALNSDSLPSSSQIQADILAVPAGPAP